MSSDENNNTNDFEAIDLSNVTDTKRIKEIKRYNKRVAKIKRWSKPLKSKKDYFLAWVNMIFSDHGIFRLIYLNKHQITPKFWRSAQPAPYQIKKMKQQGIKTIVTLRGGKAFGAWPLEKQICDELGLELKEITLRSREAPDKETLFELEKLFKEIEYPVLIHCKSGADRAGLMSALYLIMVEGVDVAQAKNQLSLKYGHFKHSKTGVLDNFLEEFIAFIDRNPEKNGDVSFMDWVRDVYDPKTITPPRLNFFESLFVEKIAGRE